MRPQSCRAKGRRHQQYIVDRILTVFKDYLEKDDVRSTSMGAGGEDILFSPLARRILPFSIEAKNVEKLNIWEAIDQCLVNSQGHEPLVVFKKNGRDTYAAVHFNLLLDLLRYYYENEVNNPTSGGGRGGKFSPIAEAARRVNEGPDGRRDDASRGRDERSKNNRKTGWD